MIDDFTGSHLVGNLAQPCFRSVPLFAFADIWVLDLYEPLNRNRLFMIGKKQTCCMFMVICNHEKVVSIQPSSDFLS